MTGGPEPVRAVGTVRALFDAVRDGDPEALWDLFATEGKQFIVGRGVRKGMAAGFGAQLLAGTADPRERGHFLRDVLGGIEKDLELVDLDRLTFPDRPEPLGAGRVKVTYLERFVVPVGPPLDPLPVGSVELVVEHGAWRIVKLVPKPG